MAKGRAGADSTPRVTHTIDGHNIIDSASELFGEKPLFWGRYFKAIHHPSDYEYVGREESPILHERGIKLLPLAQQTNFVGGSEERGASDAQLNTRDLIASLNVETFAAQGAEFLFFLDVEPTHPVSANYYRGWSRTVIAESLALSGDRFRVVPAIYLNGQEPRTWRSLISAMENGSECGGLWVASYGKPSRPGCTPLIEWDASVLTPHGIEAPCPILIWQYTEECHGGNGFDCNETNPTIDLERDLMSKLVLPPG